MGPEYITIPNPAATYHIAQGFQAMKHIPNCAGAIDGTHISIFKPTEDGDKYCNRHGIYSIHVQAVCDHCRLFISVCAGYPGSCSDMRVYRNSDFSKKVDRWLRSMPAAEVHTGPNQTATIPYYILGDSAYINSKHMVTCYKPTEYNRDLMVRRCNKHLSGMRYVIENAFGVFKRRFGLFQNPLEMGKHDVARTTDLILAAMILHNFVIIEENVQFSDEEEDADDEEEEADNEGEGGNPETREAILAYCAYTAR